MLDMFCVPYHRDLRVAASLKQKIHGQARVRVSHHRDLRVAASLKRDIAQLGQHLACRITAIFGSRPH